MAQFGEITQFSGNIFAFLNNIVLLCKKDTKPKMKKYIVPTIKPIAIDTKAQLLLVTSGGGNNVDNPSMGWGDDAPLLRRDFDFDEDE